MTTHRISSTALSAHRGRAISSTHCVRLEASVVAGPGPRLSIAEPRRPTDQGHKLASASRIAWVAEDGARARSARVQSRGVCHVEIDLFSCHRDFARRHPDERTGTRIEGEIRNLEVRQPRARPRPRPRRLPPSGSPRRANSRRESVRNNAGSSGRKPRRPARPRARRGRNTGAPATSGSRKKTPSRGLVETALRHPKITKGVGEMPEARARRQ